MQQYCPYKEWTISSSLVPETDHFRASKDYPHAYTLLNMMVIRLYLEKIGVEPFLFAEILHNSGTNDALYSTPYFPTISLFKSLFTMIYSEFSRSRCV